MCLQPDGYVQWGGVDVESRRIEACSPGVPINHLVSLWVATMSKGSRLFLNWVKSLLGIFDKEGSVNVKADWQVGKRHTGLAIYWCNLPIHEVIGARLWPSNPSKAVKIRELVREDSIQSSKGAVYAFDRVYVVGQKPAISCR